MNPLLLVAALAAVPLSAAPAPAPAARAEFTPAPADATRAVAFRLRVVSLHNELPDGLTLRPGATGVTEAQVRTLLETAELDRRGGVLQAPTITAADGQTATVSIGDTRTFTTGVEARVQDGRVTVVPTTKEVEVGIRLELTGRIAADGKAVAARLKYTDTRVGDVVRGVALNLRHVGDDGLERNGVVTLAAPEVNTATVEAAVRLPAGGAVVIPGPTQTQEVREEFGVPVLSRIPYVSRLFTNVGVTRVPVRTYLVLSAVVIEEEPALPVAPAPRPVGR